MYADHTRWDSKPAAWHTYVIHWKMRNQGGFEQNLSGLETKLSAKLYIIHKCGGNIPLVYFGKVEGQCNPALPVALTPRHNINATALALTQKR